MSALGLCPCVDILTFQKHIWMLHSQPCIYCILSVSGSTMWLGYLLSMLSLIHTCHFTSVHTSEMASYFSTSVSWPWSHIEAVVPFLRESVFIVIVTVLIVYLALLNNFSDCYLCVVHACAIFLHLNSNIVSVWCICERSASLNSARFCGIWMKTVCFCTLQYITIYSCYRYYYTK